MQKTHGNAYYAGCGQGVFKLPCQNIVIFVDITARFLISRLKPDYFKNVLINPKES